VTNPSWGTKRNCPSCNANFYDLNQLPATCPKCSHHFDPTVVARVKRKSAKRDLPEEKTDIAPAALAPKKMAPKKKEKSDDEVPGDNLGDVAEIEDVDDIENLQDLSELEEMEDTSVNEDDVDEEALIEDLNTGKNGIISNVEDEEEIEIDEDAEEESESSGSKKKPARSKKK